MPAFRSILFSFRSPYQLLLLSGVLCAQRSAKATAQDGKVVDELCEALGNYSSHSDVEKILARLSQGHIPSLKHKPVLWHLIARRDTGLYRFIPRLIEQGADPNHVGPLDNSPLGEMVFSTPEGSQEEEVKAWLNYLLLHGAQVNQTLEWGNSVLHLAVQRRGADRLFFVKHLLAQGAQASLKNDLAQTPLDFLTRWSSDEDEDKEATIKLLKEKMAAEQLSRRLPGFIGVLVLFIIGVLLWLKPEEPNEDNPRAFDANTQDPLTQAQTIA